MKRHIYIIGGLLLLMISCTSKKSPNGANFSDLDSFAVMDSMCPDMPPPPDSGRFEGHQPPPPPDGKHSDEPSPPPPHGKGHHKPDNMRGFDPKKVGINYVRSNYRRYSR